MDSWKLFFSFKNKTPLYTSFFRIKLVSAKTSSKVKSYGDYVTGVTVETDSTSPTGYYATFIFEDETKKATKVELYSDCFYLFTLEDGFSLQTSYRWIKNELLEKLG